jgi:hypothetical protein
MFMRFVEPAGAKQRIEHLPGLHFTQSFLTGELQEACRMSIGKLSYEAKSHYPSLMCSSEPPRDCRRLFCLSHAATAVSAIMA